MAQSIVVSGLVSKRAELVGRLEHYAQEVDRLDAELRHLDATIKLFAPEMDLRTLPPKRFVETNRIFRQGESNRCMLEVLREAGGKLNTQQIAQRIAKKKNLDEAKVKAVRDTILDTLRRAEKKGVVRQSGKEGMALLWQLV
ncbi:hypothetical protein SKTS_01730 [Sulfurimicrobium lacus]|uniref:Uncharacterized protein n=1 Tax=Sulfurimicrobium lacus TaxID=2715678 RepID=A0A6F8V848_9PROT|nr:hypothetical protein [Sulfurimicrobium lacus]BCB25287.1 hypothetical protein SKTS_01730 [Sulfurimicrobium lacus]